jgi:flagellar protein FliT
MDPRLLTYYEAIERASAEMLEAARAGNWDEVVKLEGACVLLISRLKQAAHEAPDPAAPAAAAPAHAPAAQPSAAEVARMKSRIMQRILVNDAEVRQLAEPWLQDLDETLAGRRKTLH